MTRIWIRKRYYCGAMGDGHVRARTLHNLMSVTLTINDFVFIFRSTSSVIVCIFEQLYNTLIAIQELPNCQISSSLILTKTTVPGRHNFVHCLLQLFTTKTMTLVFLNDLTALNIQEYLYIDGKLQDSPLFLLLGT